MSRLIISITSMQSKPFFVVTNNCYFVPSHGWKSRWYLCKDLIYYLSCV